MVAPPAGSPHENPQFNTLSPKSRVKSACNQTAGTDLDMRKTIPLLLALGLAGVASPAGAAGGEEKPAKPPAKKGKGGKKPETEQMQEELPLDQAMRGRFKGLDPTMVDGQDLDIPTFIRMRIRLK